jgi:uncharacterized protein (TIGR02996 family)
MSDAAALLAAIRATPDDDAPRLVYADWLEEHGQPERAEFIRVQCELARHESPTLRQREAELHHDSFAGPVAAPGLRFRFSRGFPVGFGHTGVFVSKSCDGQSGERTHFRFKPNCSVAIVDLMSTATAVVIKLLDSLEARSQQYSFEPYFATYILDAITYPATIRIAATLGERWLDYQGTFEGATVHLEQRNSESDGPVRRTYAHISIDGHHSFPET